ncbi:type II secretion system F family protein [Allorhodopirellula solitaria]|uniref:Type II secretion system protein F n=1 Tax=Allorhodopirellula solitaria TaxID=2527987 RepID=A0A5C5YKN4_9BACT|nr:Type II secretion system F domain protein [Allorhodopirellula solitaria]TWT75411.1 Type II secretion system protein F [Allorhodopirellula solitaria]
MTAKPENSVAAVTWISDWLPVRDKIVLALTSTADRFSGRARKKLLRLADAIAFAKQDSDILQNPMALEIFLTLAGRSGDEDSPVVGHDTRSNPEQETARQEGMSETGNDEADGVDQCEDDLHVSIEHAVNGVLLTHLPVQAARQRLFTLLFYPLLVLLACGMILFLTSALLVPTFKSMFDEFGLTLPASTQFLFMISDAARSPWTYVWLVGILLCVCLFLYLRSRPPTESTSASVGGSRFRSTRGVCGDWAWHVSLLMRAGLDKADAIEIAGDSCMRDWLQRNSQFWAQELRRGRNPFVGLTHFRGVRCQLLADTLALESPSPAPTAGVSRGAAMSLDQAGILRDIAEIYWDRTQPGSTRSFGCLSQVLYMGVLISVGLIVTALFAPLVQLITGLS